MDVTEKPQDQQKARKAANQGKEQNQNKQSKKGSNSKTPPEINSP
jgi:hypothetical protein